MSTYTVEPGREIYKDGKPFVSVGREGDTRPVDADSFTHLAAAAPELLAALELAVKAVGPENAGIRNAAHAAIAKARGTNTNQEDK